MRSPSTSRHRPSERRSGLRLGIALLSMLLLLPALLSPTLSAQPRKKKRAVPIPESDHDTIPGGLLSALTVRTTRPDSLGRLLSKPDSARHSINIDFIKMAAYANVSYHYAVSRMVMVGGEVLFTPGLLGRAGEVRGWGIGLDQKIFFRNRGLQGMHVNFSQNFYSLVLDAKGDHITSFTFDFAHRYMAGRSIFLDLQLGAEYFFDPWDARSGASTAPMFIAFEEEEKWAPHIVLRAGFLW